jgi:hypothetical protein
MKFHLFFPLGWHVDPSGWLAITISVLQRKQVSMAHQIF